MKPPLATLPAEARRRLVKRKQPTWASPMLATLTDEAFSDERWIFERKLDGVRCLAFRAGDRVRLFSRNRKDQNRTYPELVQAMAAQEAEDFIVDGEIVAFEGKVTSFSRLQRRMKITDPVKAQRVDVAIFYYLFDILHLDGHDTSRVPLRERKALLKRAIDFERPLRFSDHRDADGEAYLEEACSKGWEGLIAKRADGAYVHGRSRDWLKLKCVARQEFVVGGWTDPRGERVSLGALLVGVYDDGAFRYAGKVGTGFDDETLRRLRERLASRERKTPPFADADAIPKKGVHWATPTLVVEVAFTEWTADGRLRHPRFVGFRNDKSPEDVVREAPA